jgi:hypothetical protein
MISNHATDADTLLLSQHQDLLDGSAISREVARARGYRSVTKGVELRRLGFSDRQSRVPALLIPVWNVSGEIATYQIRPDEPRMVDGEPIKYETPSGARMVLDVPPPAREWIPSPERPLFLTEGVRKADAAVSHGLCCLAVLGVWNWRGTNPHGGKAALPDWEYIAVKAREVYVCFDSDVMLKPQVHEAMARLKAFLEHRGARVSLIYLPHGEGGSKVGLDDFLGTGHSVEDLLSLASSHLRSVTPEDDKARALPYATTPSGILWQKPTHDGVAPVPLTNFSATINREVIEDDGTETRRSFEIEAHLNGRASRFEVPAVQFNSMGWHLEHLGAEAVIFPGFGVRDHARTAIQVLSGKIRQQRVYTHTGWRNTGQTAVYLHGGGAIGPGGPVDDLEVRLPGDLGRFELPEPPTGPDLVEAVRASLRLVEIAPESIILPLFASIWRAVVKTCDFSIHIFGPTGKGKTELAALVQQHWGPDLDARNLPASWLSTGNALEGLAFAAKDAILVVDDLAPAGAATDIARLHREADRLLRAQGNRSGRQRMRADGTLRPAKPPRGLIVSTGEDLPRGQSLRARILVLELSPGMMDWAGLTECQRDAAAGLYAKALAGFIKWLAPQYEAMSARSRERLPQLRQEASANGWHPRSPDVVANLALGLEWLLTFARQADVLTDDEASSLRARGWKAFLEAAAAQGTHQVATEPAQRFIELLRAAIVSGRAHIAGPDGDEPYEPMVWGWRAVTASTGGDRRTEWRPQGDRIGWMDGDDLYLEPEASYIAVQRMGRDAGEVLPVGSKTLHKRLHERGLLASTEEARRTLTVRRMLEGSRRTVLHVRPESLVSLRTDQAAQSTAPDAADAGLSGQLPGQIHPHSAKESDQGICPQSLVTTAHQLPSGSLGSLFGRDESRR